MDECKRIMSVVGGIVARCGKPGTPTDRPGAYEVLCDEHQAELAGWVSKMADVIKEEKPSTKRKRSRKKADPKQLSLREMKKRQLLDEYIEETDQGIIPDSGIPARPVRLRGMPAKAARGNVERPSHY